MVATVITAVSRILRFQLTSPSTASCMLYAPFDTDPSLFHLASFRETSWMVFHQRVFDCIFQTRGPPLAVPRSKYPAETPETRPCSVQVVLVEGLDEQGQLWMYISHSVMGVHSL